MGTSSRIKRHAEEGGHIGLTALARAGYAARGIVYLVVGVLALLTAVHALGVSTGGASGGTAGTKGALQVVLGLPAGPWLVGAMAAGLLGFTIWRLVQGFGDADSHGRDAKGIVIRGGLIVSGLIHLGLAVYAASLLWSAGGGGGTPGWSAWLARQWWGSGVIAAFGLFAMGVAAAQVRKAVRKTYRKTLRPSAAAPWIDGIARFGLGAKALVLGMVGVFLVAAAFGWGSAGAAGLSQVLSTLLAQPYGAWLLGVTAAGLGAFGVYGLVQAWYRIIPTP